MEKLFITTFFGIFYCQKVIGSSVNTTFPFDILRFVLLFKPTYSGTIYAFATNDIVAFSNSILTHFCNSFKTSKNHLLLQTCIFHQKNDLERIQSVRLLY